MTQQTSFWQEQQQSSDFAELCCGLYERELGLLANAEIANPSALQGRLKSLPYYVKRTAYLMLQAKSPLTIDYQNASWSAKQAAHIPLSGQEIEAVNQWYLTINLEPGLVVPIAENTHIVLDSIDRIDLANQRFRTNLHGWFMLNDSLAENPKGRLLKPNKRVMTAACTGHTWVNDHKSHPMIPSLRELLLSCAIDWRSFKRPIAFN